MKRLAAIFSVLAVVVSVPAATMMETLNSEVASLYEKSKDAVVKVHAQRTPVLNGMPLTPIRRVGTGFFVDESGRLMTSASVTEGAESCSVEIGGQQIPATLVGRDPVSNLAILKIDPEKCGGKTLALKFGDSDDMRVGSLVVALGFAYDMPCAPVVGFIGSTDMGHGTRRFPTAHLRAGCRLSPGQGGGPLLNHRGEVVGIAVAACPDEQCYALPSNAARRVLADIVRCGQVNYGWVGLGVTEQLLLTTNSAMGTMQVIVQQVYSNSPAANVGFRERDLLVRIGTNQVLHATDVLKATFSCRPGDQLNVTIQRDGQEQKLTLTAGERPTNFQPTPQTMPVRLPIIPAAATRP